MSSFIATESCRCSAFTFVSFHDLMQSLRNIHTIMFYQMFVTRLVHKNAVKTFKHFVHFNEKAKPRT